MAQMVAATPGRGKLSFAEHEVAQACSLRSCRQASGLAKQCKKLTPTLKVADTNASRRLAPLRPAMVQRFSKASEFSRSFFSRRDQSSQAASQSAPAKLVFAVGPSLVSASSSRFNKLFSRHFK